jgi:hypothetical protein
MDREQWFHSSLRRTAEVSGGCKPSAGVTCYVSFMEIFDICLYDEQYVGKLSNYFSYLL